MIVVLAALVAAGIVLPHALRLERVAPITELFGALTHWCLHAVVPLVAAHLGFSGHSLGDAALVLPGILLAASLASAAFGVARAARTVRGWLARGAVGVGPDDTVVVRGPGVLVAAAGLARPRLVVSAGALT